MSEPPPKGPPRRFDGPLFASALARAREVLANSLPPTAPGYRLFWVVGAAVGWFDLPAGGAFAVIGSHEQCDVVLRGDARIAFRHLLATTIELADGLALRLLDLRTGIPFHLEDGAPRYSIVASGPVVAQIGRFIIGGVPASPGKLELPDAPPAVILEERTELPLSVHAPPTLLPQVRGVRAISFVTSLPPASSIAAVSRPAPARAEVSRSLASRAEEEAEDAAPETRSGVMLRHDALAAAKDDAIADIPRQAPQGPYRRAAEVPPLAEGMARITLRYGDLSATLTLDKNALELGVLIGRIPTCHDPRLLAVLNGGISRGHVLLFRHHDACEAFDLCSTQGTYVAERRVRRIRLAREGTSLRLASQEPVSLDWSGG